MSVCATCEQVTEGSRECPDLAQHLREHPPHPGLTDAQRAEIRRRLRAGEYLAFETSVGPMVLPPPEPREAAADVIDAGNRAVRQEAARPGRVQTWARRWLGGLLGRDPDGRGVPDSLIVEAAWEVLRDLEPPIASRVSDLSRTEVFVEGGPEVDPLLSFGCGACRTRFATHVELSEHIAGCVTFAEMLANDTQPPAPRCMPKYWKELPASPGSYLRKAIRTKARVLAARYGWSPTVLGAEDRDRRDVDRRDVQRLGRTRSEQCQCGADVVPGAHCAACGRLLKEAPRKHEATLVGEESQAVDVSARAVEDLRLELIESFEREEATPTELALLGALRRTDSAAEALEAVGRPGDWSSMQSLQRKLKRRLASPLR